MANEDYDKFGIKVASTYIYKVGSFNCQNTSTLRFLVKKSRVRTSLIAFFTFMRN